MTKHRKKWIAFEKLEVLCCYNLCGVTPEQNAPIESFHSIQEKVVCQQYEFDPLRELLATINRFVSLNDFKRIHSGIGYKSPIKYLLELNINMKQNDLEEVFDRTSSKVLFIN
jgi:transposase InsO family protein